MSVEWQLDPGSAELRTALLWADLFDRSPLPAGVDYSARLGLSLARLAQLLRQPAVAQVLSLLPRLAAQLSEFDPADPSPTHLRVAELCYRRLSRLKTDCRSGHVAVARSQVSIVARAQQKPLSRPRLRVGLTRATTRLLVRHFHDVLRHQGLQETGLEAQLDDSPGLSGLIDLLLPHPLLRLALDRLRELSAILDGEWSLETYLQAGLETEVRSRLAELLRLPAANECLELAWVRSTSGPLLDDRVVQRWLTELVAVLPFLAAGRASSEVPGISHEHPDGRWQQFLLERVLEARDRDQAEVVLSVEELRAHWRFARAPARSSDRQLTVRLALWSVHETREAALAELLDLELAGAHLTMANAAGVELRVQPSATRLSGLRQSLVLTCMRALPRIRVGGLVLARARWTLSETEIGELLVCGEPALRQLRLFELRLQRKLPRWVGLLEADGELELDLECPLASLCLFSSLALHGQCTLLELPQQSIEHGVSEAGRALRNQLEMRLQIATGLPCEPDLSARSAAEPQITPLTTG